MIGILVMCVGWQLFSVDKIHPRQLYARDVNLWAGL